jgi:hypothetical protein
MTHANRVRCTIVFAIAILTVACRSSSPASSTALNDDPNQALTRFTTLLEHRDPALIDEFVDDPDVLVVGSEASEIEIGREQIAQMIKSLAAGPAVRFTWKQTRSGSKDDVAWLFASGDAVIMDSGKETRLPYRLTGVLERRNGRWKWRQFHGSEPARH